MNLFGFNISWNGKRNNTNNFVRKDECHKAQDSIKELFNQRFDGVENRLEDLKDWIRNGR